ncbi:DUF2786 domain-containing protein [Amycolatopsis sp. PS_44_ISF1]|uniref:DUF2786 domain-containing protein n=1 Tax=Amycolatopsis sp. PS_44_ISF1 TaxID=2974917 RepID=UPI0028DF8C6A|nr:DUF2786 domain-containing protein [Amycolatopsis sp. PS_44_ISF1]MDT8910908.1 DUF2786 domain-containing protein [Amycolatopsis sp. PS_44_ISF1]
MATTAAVTERVRKLLDKAEDSAVTPEEAQTYAAKAAELIAKHNLDQATVRHREGKRPEPIKLLKFEVSGQGWHGKARAALACWVAEAHGCSVCTMGNLMNGKTRWVLIMGPAATLKGLEALLPSILLQAESQGVAAAKAHLNEVRDRIDTPANANIERRTFYRTYLDAYGRGVAEKIARSREAMAERVKGKAGELVLVSDAERTKAAFEKNFPELKAGRGDKYNAAGAAAGHRDGRNVDTGQTKVGKTARAAVNG